MTTVHDTFDHFRRIRREIQAAHPDAAPRMLQEGAILGVGILIGGGFPGAAAAVTLLLESKFPEAEGWPWTGSAEA